MGTTKLMLMVGMTAGMLGASLLPGGCTFLDCQDPEVAEVEEGDFHLRAGPGSDEDETSRLEDPVIAIGAAQVVIDYGKDGTAYRVVYEVRE